MNNDILKEIRKCRKKLNDSVIKNGIQSFATRKLSDKMDDLINNYYKSVEVVHFPDNSKMKDYYKRSCDEIKSITKELNKFPTISQWNQHAKENNLLSSASLQYITKLDWNYLRAKISKEINLKI